MNASVSECGIAITQGRWYAKQRMSQIDEHATTVASVGPRYPDESEWFVFADTEHHGSQVADANLIAAAPELYRRAYDVLEGLEGVPLPGAMPTRVKKLRAALAKAGGEA